MNEKKYALVKIRIFDKNQVKKMNCRFIILEDDLEKIMSFIESSNRIVIYDSVEVFYGNNFIQDLLRKIKRDLEQEMLF